MTEPSNAEKHAVIAAKVWPDAVLGGYSKQVCILESETKGRWFNLLATNPDGSPTIQAKADAIDTSAELSINFYRAKSGKWVATLVTKDGRIIITDEYDTYCEAIFNAAWEVCRER